MRARARSSGCGPRARRTARPRDRRSAGRAHRIARRAGHAHEAAHGLGDEVERRAIDIGAGAAVAIDAADDQRRVQRCEAGGIEAHPGQHARAVVLDQHVRLAQQVGQDRLALIGVEIEGDRLLVAIELGEVPAEAVPDRALAAHRIAAPGRLDLDHLGAEVGEQLGAERARDDAGEVDHANPGERHRAQPVAVSTSSARCRRSRGPAFIT